MKPLDFMIVGAQKCGTTALSEFLDEHPDIQMSTPKEVHLFDDEAFWAGSPAGQDIQRRYQQAFEENTTSLTGEATPVYLYFTEIAERLRRYNPALKIIVILRDPVERAYSHYRMEFERGNETLPYWQALWKEGRRLSEDNNKYHEDSAHRRHSYRARGCYAEQLLALYACFPARQIMVIHNEDLRVSHQQVMKRLFVFLGVPDAQVSARTVFSGGSDIREVPWVSRILRLSFWFEIKRLARLVEFDVSPWRRLIN